MTDSDTSTAPDIEQAKALEIGMSILQARRAASEVIAEAERLARELVMTPDLRAADLVFAVGKADRVDRTTVSRAPAGLDIRSLAAQVDEIEGTLLKSHERILGLLREGPGSQPAEPHPVEPVEPPIQGHANVAEESREPAPAEPQVAQVADADPVHEEPSPPTSAPIINLASNGAGTTLNRWAPPDASSRVDLPVELEQDAPIPPPREEDRVAQVPIDQPWSPPAEHLVSWSTEPPQPQQVQQPISWPTEEPVASAAEPYVSPAKPAKTSSTLWLMNVIGFSVLLIVVVVVLMLANVL